MKIRLMCAAMPIFYAGTAAAQVAAPVPATDVDAGQPVAGAAASGANGGLDQGSQTSDRTRVEDIVVTAQKRSENLQNVPIAISAVTSSTIERLGVSSVADLSVAVPALNAAESAGRLVVSLRGIGTSAVTPGLENPIALYIDGVYIASQVGSLAALTNNIERIEVLKGPQGTLFGRNATGGLISVITKDPGPQFSGKLDLSYGRFQTVTGNAYVSGPLSDTVGFSVSLHDVRMGDGWGKNVTTGNDIYRIKRDFYTQGKLVFNPADGTKFTLIGDYANQKNSMAALTGGTGDIVPETGFVQPNIGWNAHSSVDPMSKVKQGGVSLKWNQEIGSDLNLTSITAYRKNKFVQEIDLDTVPERFTEFVVQTRDKQFTQELQLSNRSAGPLKWTLGAYLYRGESEEFTTPDEPWVRIPIADLAINVDSKMRIGSEAAFAQATYEVAEGTNLTLGGRYSHEKRVIHDSTQSTFPLSGTPADGVTVSFPKDSVSASVFTYRVSLDHRFSPEVLAYASINSGFKSGGFNLPTPGSAPFKPEKLRAYEVGLKTDLLDRRLRANLAAFYYDYSDIQVQKFEGVTIGTINGAKARSYGIDGDLTAILSDRLSLTGGATWLSPKFTEFEGCPVSTPNGGIPPSPGSCKGNLLPLAAKLTATGNVNYSIDAVGGKLELNGNVAYNSGFYTEVDNSIHQKRFALLGAQATWTDPSDQFEISVFGRNLTNQRVNAIAFTSAGGTRLVAYREPRIYGARIGYKF
jgi:iron complex outermembrane receptor protein